MREELLRFPRRPSRSGDELTKRGKKKRASGFDVGLAA